MNVITSQSFYEMRKKFATTTPEIMSKLYVISTERKLIIKKARYLVVPSFNIIKSNL